MALYLGILIFSFIITSIVIVPFIDILYRLRLTYKKNLPPFIPLEAFEHEEIQTKNQAKVGTPVGGGVLIIGVVCLLYVMLFPILSFMGIPIDTVYFIKDELNILFFVFISFAMLGLYEDLQKLYPGVFPHTGIYKTGVKFCLILILSLIVGLILHFNLGLSYFNIPGWGKLSVGLFYIPISALIIGFFTKAVDIADGLDGLAPGLLLINLFAFWVTSYTSLDVPLTILIALWIGSLVAFMYSNVYPARIWLGNSGSLSFGATLAVIALLLGKTVSLFFIGGFFVIEAIIQFGQYVFSTFFHRRLLTVSPLHYLLELKGWPESKVVMRSWLIGLSLAIIGLYVAGV